MQTPLLEIVKSTSIICTQNVLNNLRNNRRFRKLDIAYYLNNSTTSKIWNCKKIRHFVKHRTKEVKITYIGNISAWHRNMRGVSSGFAFGGLHIEGTYTESCGMFNIVIPNERNPKKIIQS